jgi:heat shock protein HslJ
VRGPARGAVSFFLAVGLVVMGGCSGGDDLDGTSWLAVQLGPRPTVPDVRSTAAFEAGTISGSGGCNSFTGTYEADASSGVYGGGPPTISVEGIGSTEMACEELVMAQEQLFLDSLRAATTYRIVADRLELLEGDEVLIAFVRQATD